MNRIARCFMILAIAFACLIGGKRIVSASEPSSDLARASLQKQGYPWYDAKIDQFRPTAQIKEVEPKPDTPNQPVTNSNTTRESGAFFQQFQMILMWVLLIAVITVVAIIAFRTVQEAMQDSSPREVPATVALESLEALPEPVRKVNDLLGEATRQASLSAFDTAMMFYYSWQLVQLDRHQHIELQKGKTNRQYKREVNASAPQLLDLFSPSMRLFEDTFFGQLPVSKEDFMQVWEQRHQFEFTPGRRRS